MGSALTYIIIYNNNNIVYKGRSVRVRKVSVLTHRLDLNRTVGVEKGLLLSTQKMHISLLHDY